jgi:hypothetical protein
LTKKILVRNYKRNCPVFYKLEEQRPRGRGKAAAGSERVEAALTIHSVQLQLEPAQWGRPWCSYRTPFGYGVREAVPHKNLSPGLGGVYLAVRLPGPAQIANDVVSRPAAMRLPDSSNAAAGQQQCGSRGQNADPEASLEKKRRLTHTF